jgi:hypothetical protein
MSHLLRPCQPTQLQRFQVLDPLLVALVVKVLYQLNRAPAKHCESSAESPRSRQHQAERHTHKQTYAHARARARAHVRLSHTHTRARAHTHTQTA